MNTVALSSIFDIVYGSQLDFNKLEIDLENGINFISRSRENLGVYTKIKKIANKPLFKKGGITVTLGGSYLLSSFVQQEDFYTAQNIKVLTPKQPLTDLQKKFYCYAIEHNRFRYTSHGREANKTLNDLLVPSIDSIPKWLNTTKIKTPSKKSILNKKLELNTTQWEYFKYSDIFDIKKGKRLTKAQMTLGDTLFIGASDSNNGQTTTIGQKPIHYGNTISVNYDGSIGEAFYQDKPFYALDSVNVLYLKSKLNPLIAMFLTTVIRQEKFRFNYGRKWGKEKMLSHKIKLPVKNNQPDWQFMEDYIKSLPYSGNL